MSRFMVPKQGGSVPYVCTKFEVDSYFRSKVIRGYGSNILGFNVPLNTV